MIEPFGYFRPTPFGWEDCAPDDEGARPLFEHEDVGGMFAIYADIGRMDEDGEPIELIELSQGRSCEETLSALRKLCEEELQ